MADNSQFFTKLIETGEFRINESGHATLFGEYLFLIPPSVILELQEQLTENLGHDAMEELMVELGRYQVKQAGSRHNEKYDLNSMSKEKILNYFENIWNILGWGNVSVTRLDRDDGVLEITVKQPTLPAEYRVTHDTPAEQPVCHYLRGMIIQAFYMLFGEDQDIIESQCAAVEGDRCVFEKSTG